MPLRYLRAASLALPCLLALPGCSNQPSYVIDHDEYTDFSRYKTYSWYDDTHDSKLADYRQYNASDKRVRAYVDRELKLKGFTESAGGDADFWVNYNIAKEDHMKIDSFSNYPSAGMHGAASVGTYGSGVSIGYSSGPSVKQYSEGTVVLDVIDSHTDKIVWRGIAEGRLKSSLTQKDKNRIASQVSRELLADFPPGPSPTP